MAVVMKHGISDLQRLVAMASLLRAREAGKLRRQKIKLDRGSIRSSLKFGVVYLVLDTGIFIIVQQGRMMMFSLSMVDYPMSFLSMSTWNFYGWTSRGDHSKPFLLSESWVRGRVGGRWVAFRILVLAQGPLGLREAFQKKKDKKSWQMTKFLICQLFKDLFKIHLKPVWVILNKFFFYFFRGGGTPNSNFFRQNCQAQAPNP